MFTGIYIFKNYSGQLERALVFALIFLLLPSAQADFDPYSYHLPNACRSYDPADWDRFKNHVMADFPLEGFMKERLKIFQRSLSECSDQIQSQSLSSCLERMEYLARITVDAHKSKIHAWKTNIDYFNSQDQKIVGLPDEFKKGVPDNFRDIIRAKGWKCITFKSKLTTNKPHGEDYFRTIVLVPKTVDGKKVMQRIMIVSHTPVPDKTANIQIITTEHDYQGRMTGRFGDKGARIHFTALEYDTRGTTLILDRSNNSCAECHMTGPITIKPDPTFSPQFCGEYTLAEFNKELINDATRPNLDQVLDPDLHFPNLEIGNFPISKSGIVGEAGPGSKKCTDCHNLLMGERNRLLPAMFLGNAFLGPLTSLPMWVVEVDLHNHMPPGVTLSPGQWRTAQERLLEEMQTGIKKYVTDVKCVDDNPPGSQAKPGPAKSKPVSGLEDLGGA